MGLSNDLTMLAASEMNYRHRVEHLQRLGAVGPNPTWGEVAHAEQEMRRERRGRRQAQPRARTAMPLWVFWTFGVIAALAASTVVGLPLTVALALVMWWKHPWLPASSTPAPDEAPTVAIPTVGAGRHAR